MKRLRKGYTTGMCAAAAAQAATTILLGGNSPTQVTLLARTGELVTIEISEILMENDWVRCGTVKDAGDDPDVTNGMTVYTAVRQSSQPGVAVDGGEGIGRVTKPGLKVAVGKAAINPVPMQMITAAINSACLEQGYSGGIEAVVSIPGGQEVAKKTMNARLGVIGGLSILGSTGIVEPMSDQALVDTVKTEIDVVAASGVKTLLMMPGNYGRSFAQQTLGLDTSNAVRFANFVGEALDHISETGVQSIMLIGHAGKLVKLAGGIMDTHSRNADCRLEIITAHAALAGASPEIARQLMECVTTEAAIDILLTNGINTAVWQSIGDKIAFYLEQRTKGQVAIEFVVFTEEHGVLVRKLVERKANKEEV
jgi:cobalt-precorrin-5B (C1)-methyltransferase